MFDSLRNGWVDGYCVGEPWNQRAVFHGDGVIVALKDDIWPRSPEKVLGLREDWVQNNRDVVAALVRALVRAAEWADQPGNRLELAHILSEEANVGAPFEVLKASLCGRPVLRPGEPPVEMPDRHVFYRYTATFPWLSQGRWLGEQMKRWGQIPGDVNLDRVIPDVYRPDLYRMAVAGLDVLVPQNDSRIEGAADAPDRSLVGPDRFLDDSVFGYRDGLS
jgi:NitT/TauT family transport system ATP-binding protein/nitrate/nitrite transport system substrate-binding protein